MRFCELREKEVINIRDCHKLGFVADIDFDPDTGCICRLIIPGPGKFCGFLGRDIEFIIGWDCVKQIGEDIILVDVDFEEIKSSCKN